MVQYGSASGREIPLFYIYIYINERSGALTEAYKFFCSFIIGRRTGRRIVGGKETVVNGLCAKRVRLGRDSTGLEELNLSFMGAPIDDSVKTYTWGTSSLRSRTRALKLLKVIKNIQVSKGCKLHTVSNDNSRTDPGTKKKAMILTKNLLFLSIKKGLLSIYIYINIRKKSDLILSPFSS